ncbi:MAG: 4-hydroxythreonine-4-phosphate dehydrogenase PdxA [Opitutales bacterium]
MKTPLCITLGDPNGIGPEILVDAFQRGWLPDDTVVAGDAEVVRCAADLWSESIPIRCIDRPEDRAEGDLNVLDQQRLTRAELRPGRVARSGGEAGLAYVAAAVDGCRAGHFRGMVTLPLNKEAVRLADPGFSGHTGWIADRCGVDDSVMMLVADALAVTHVSTHVSLREAIERVRPDRVEQVIRVTAATLRRLGRGERLAVAGLNPHAGEGGAFGREEAEGIEPAIRSCQQAGLTVSGPHPPDVVFRQAVDGRFDAVVCMYHDQGHIPLKLLDFHGGVNVTLGLPFWRTSVDHGTAYDIAYQRKADPASLRAAICLAERLCGV